MIYYRVFWRPSCTILWLVTGSFETWKHSIFCSSHNIFVSIISILKTVFLCVYFSYTLIWREQYPGTHHAEDVSAHYIFFILFHCSSGPHNLSVYLLLCDFWICFRWKRTPPAIITSTLPSNFKTVPTIGNFFTREMRTRSIVMVGFLGRVAEDVYTHNDSVVGVRSTRALSVPWTLVRRAALG